MATTDGLRFDAAPLRRAVLVWGKGFKELARLLGCQTSTAQKIINGQYPTSKLLPKAAKILGVDLDDCWLEQEEAPNELAR